MSQIWINTSFPFRRCTELQTFTFGREDADLVFFGFRIHSMQIGPCWRGVCERLRPRETRDMLISYDGSNVSYIWTGKKELESTSQPWPVWCISSRECGPAI